MKNIFTAILLGLPLNLFAVEFTSISLQGRLSSTDTINNVSVFLDGINLGAILTLAPDAKGVFSTKFSVSPSDVLAQCSACVISLKKSDGTVISTSSLRSVPFALTVRGDGPDSNLLRASGNIGIGTTNPNPAYKLDVQGGDINTSANVREAGVSLSNKYAYIGGSNVAGPWPISITGTASGAAPTGAAGGNLSGNYPNPAVSSLPAISGASLIGLTAANIASGSLGAQVIASSVAINSVYDGAIVGVSGTKVGPGVPAMNIANGSLGALVVVSSVGVNSVYPNAVKTGTYAINIAGIASSAPPSGPASGVLTGIYPNPALAATQTATVTWSGMQTFSSATITGNAFSVGGAALVVGGGKVGIGTVNPEQKLTIAGNISLTGQIISSGTGNNYLAGNVGIGTTNPGTALEVNGQVKITGGAPGANRVLTSDSAGLATWQVPIGGGIPYLHISTFGASGVWVTPPGVTQVEVWLIGGGGGGGSQGAGNNNGNGGGGGGGGSVIHATVAVTGTIAVIIGAGGAGAPYFDIAPTNGGASSFGALLIAPGGGAGGSHTFNGGAGSPGGCGGGDAAQSAHVPGGGGGGAARSCVATRSSPTGLGTNGGNGCAVVGAPGPQNGGEAVPGVSIPVNTTVGFGGGGGGGLGDGFINTAGIGGSGAGNGAINDNIYATSGVPNHGGGGGGGYNNTPKNVAGGAGGSGYCVVLWYQ